MLNDKEKHIEKVKGLLDSFRNKALVSREVRQRMAAGESLEDIKKDMGDKIDEQNLNFFNSIFSVKREEILAKIKAKKEEAKKAPSKKASTKAKEEVVEKPKKKATRKKAASK